MKTAAIGLIAAIVSSQAHAINPETTLKDAYILSVNITPSSDALIGKGSYGYQLIDRDLDSWFFGEYLVPVQSNKDAYCVLTRGSPAPFGYRLPEGFSFEVIPEKVHSGAFEKYSEVRREGTRVINEMGLRYHVVYMPFRSNDLNVGGLTCVARNRLTYCCRPRGL